MSVNFSASVYSQFLRNTLIVSPTVIVKTSVACGCRNFQAAETSTNLSCKVTLKERPSSVYFCTWSNRFAALVFCDKQPGQLSGLVLFYLHVESILRRLRPEVCTPNGIFIIVNDASCHQGRRSCGACGEVIQTLVFTANAIFSK